MSALLRTVFCWICNECSVISFSRNTWLTVCFSSFRPPPPQPKISSQGNLIPARPAPAPPLYSSLTWLFYLSFCRYLQGTELILFFFLIFSWKAFLPAATLNKNKILQNELTNRKTNWVMEIEKYKKFSEAREFRVTFSFLSLNKSFSVICEVMHLTWIMLFWTCYCNDFQINSIGLCFFIMCLNVILNFDLSYHYCSFRSNMR